MNRLTIRLCALILVGSVVLSPGLAAEPPAPPNMTGAVVAAFLKPLAKAKASDRAVHVFRNVKCVDSPRLDSFHVWTAISLSV